MMLSAYNPPNSRQLALAITANAGDARILDTGGGWHPGTWRENVRALATQGRINAVALRTEPNERPLTDREWSHTLREMTATAGLQNRPWAAVLTNPTTVTLLTNSAHPLRIDDARGFLRAATFGRRVDTAAAARTGPVSETATETAKGPAVGAGVAGLSFAGPPTGPTGTPPGPPASAVAPVSPRRTR